MAANVTTTLTSWSTTESSNRPVAGDTVDVDDELRMIQAVVRKYLATKGADIASAATVDLSTATGNYVHITGTTTVTALGTLTAGLRYLLVFDGALTFTHNATSLILPGAANITTAAGDRCEVVSLGSGNWRCLWYQKASGVHAITGANTFTGLQTLSGVSRIDANASIAAHATTMDPWSLGNYVTCTGAAVTFTAMAAAPQAGAEVELYMNAAHVFTDGAVFEVDGDANFTAEAGDRVLLRAKSTTVFTVHPRKKNGTAVGALTPSEVVVHTGNGHGSTNTAIRRFSTTQINTGSDITYSDSATAGASFTINTTGYYAISYADLRTTADTTFGVSLNSAELTTNVASITVGDRLMMAQTAAANFRNGVSRTLRLSAADVVRPHTDLSADGATNATVFRITRIA